MVGRRERGWERETGETGAIYFVSVKLQRCAPSSNTNTTMT